MGKVTATDVMKLLQDGKSPPCMEDLEEGILKDTDPELISEISDFWRVCDELFQVKKSIAALADKESKR